MDRTEIVGHALRCLETYVAEAGQETGTVSTQMARDAVRTIKYHLEPEFQLTREEREVRNLFCFMAPAYDCLPDGHLVPHTITEEEKALWDLSSAKRRTFVEEQKAFWAEHKQDDNDGWKLYVKRLPDEIEKE